MENREKLGLPIAEKKERRYSGISPMDADEKKLGWHETRSFSRLKNQEVGMEVDVPH